MAPPSTNVVISKRVVAINALSLLISRFLAIGMLVWVNQYLLRRLSESEYAPFPVVTALVMFLQVFTAGLMSGISRYIIEAVAKGEPNRVTEIVSSMMPTVFGGACAFFMLGGLLCWNLDSLLTLDAAQTADAQVMMAVLIGGHCVVLVGMPFSVGLQVRQKFVWIAVIRLAGQILQIAILMTLLFGVSTRVMWVVVAGESASITMAAVSFALSRHLLPELRFDRARIRRDTARELRWFGAWTMLGNLLYRIRTSADVMILNKFGSNLDVTAYHVGTIPDRQMDSAVGPAGAALDPALTAMHATNKSDALRRAYLRGNRFYLWMMLAAAVPLIVFARELVELYVGSKYMLAAGVLALVSARYPFMYAGGMLYRVAMATAKIRRFYVISSVFAVIRISGAIVLVGSYGLGAMGVAYMSIAVTVVAQVGFLWPLGRRMLDITVAQYVRETLLPGWMPAVVSAGSCLAVGAAVPPSSWATVTFDIAVGLIGYGLAVLALAKPEDRRDFGRVFRKVGGSWNRG